MVVRLKIAGEPCPKANEYRIVFPGGNKAKKPFLARYVKSATKQYQKALIAQIKPLDPLLEGDLIFRATLFYASRRKDLDESLILDALQGLIYANDRQIKEKHIYHDLDKDNPRAEIVITQMDGPHLEV